MAKAPAPTTVPKKPPAPPSAKPTEKKGAVATTVTPAKPATTTTTTTTAGSTTTTTTAAPPGEAGSVTEGTVTPPQIDVAIEKVVSSSPILDSFSKGDLVSKIVGAPPSLYLDSDAGNTVENWTMASMPIMAIYPAYPKYGNLQNEKGGLQLFHLDYAKGRDMYNNILKSVGVNGIGSESCLYVMFLNDTTFSESFSVEYGESKFEEIGNMASSTAQELAYITGQQSLGKALDVGAGALKEHGILGKVIGGMTDMAGSVVGGLENFIEGRVSGMSKIMIGHKIDFPQMWKGSGFATSYSITVRLFNPNVGDLASHMKFIVEPLAKLLALIVPVSSSESTFTFPLLCSISCPGLFKLKGGYISSIEVVKGGESQDVSFIQRPGTIDLKIGIGDLYNSIVADDVEIDSTGGGKAPADNPAGNGGSAAAPGATATTGKFSSADPFRPTFRDYINQLSSKASIPNLSLRDAMSQAASSGVKVTSENSTVTNTTASTTVTPSRVSDASKATANSLAPTP